MWGRVGCALVRSCFSGQGDCRTLRYSSTLGIAPRSEVGIGESLKRGRNPPKPNFGLYAIPVASRGLL